MAKKRGNNEGTIYRRKDGTWCSQITIGRDPKAGKEKRVTFYGKTRQEAADKLNKALNDVKQGTFVEPTKLTVGEWLDTWLEDYKKLELRLTSWERYKGLSDNHIKPAIGSIVLKDLRPQHLQQLYNEKVKEGLAPATIRKIHNVIHAALNQALKNQLVVRNVSEATTLPSTGKREVGSLTPEEMDYFLNVVAEDRLSAAFVCLLGTGLRRGELLALTWQDVDLAEGVIHVRRGLVRTKEKGLIFREPKTVKSRRSIPLPDDVVASLKAHKVRQNQEKLLLGLAYQDSGLVFCSEVGTPIEPRNFNRKFYQLREKAGIEGVNLHSLRHTYATRLLEAGESLKVVQELLGHSKIAMTADIYSHVSPELKREAVAKLNGTLRPKKKPSTAGGS